VSAVRRSRSSAEQSRKLPFDYTADEWQRIAAACPSGLSAQARRALSTAARQFSALGNSHEWLKAFSVREQQRWNEVSKLAAQLRGAIWRATEHHALIDGYVKKLDAGLSKLEKDAKAHGGPRPVVTRNTLLQRYYQAVLCVWTDHLGREIKRSNDGNHESGPLARFFNAAIEPVLGDAAPANGTLKGIFEREKRRRAGLH
jgi:hypothetical protein